MTLQDAITKTLASGESRSGITFFDVAVSKLLATNNNSPAVLAAELAEVARTAPLEDDRFWYFIDLAALRLKVVDRSVANVIRRRILSDTGANHMKGRYYALKALGRTTGHGILPDEVMAQNEMRLSAPLLWLDLVLQAFQNGNPVTIQSEIVALVSGRTPALSWQDIRSKLTEIRKAIGDVPTFRQVMREVARSLHVDDHRLHLLRAVDNRVGGDLASEAYRPVRAARHREGPRNFHFGSKVLKREKTYQTKEVRPVALEAA